ncbi:dephospho-CoA kinase [Pseudoalteromonas ulvae UL12]|uniref:dephospho-CoA kinase n=1 Tax=Pseudoalteromonas ulvae TaxID=107327 RepID=UPI00186B6674|nr:dephospho-CoA kinase [Pseudoalteromonas ulvae]MBE0363042.1 dephospho-CoA kinase [Pseudoalteromonas ulvae UL12]
MVQHYPPVLLNKPVIGLTGGIGSGKTAIANMFAKQGIELVDADIIARDVVAVGSPALKAISQHFGTDILLSNGELNRAKLREQIFTHPVDKTWLNNLLHPLIREKIHQDLNAATSQYVILVAPLLFENQLDQICTRTVLIDAPESLQISRTSARDNVSTAQIEAIIAAQMSRSEKQKKADDIIDNSKDLPFAQQQVSQLHQEYLGAYMDSPLMSKRKSLK